VHNNKNLLQSSHSLNPLNTRRCKWCSEAQIGIKCTQIINCSCAECLELLQIQKSHCQRNLQELDAKVHDSRSLGNTYCKGQWCKLASIVQSSLRFLFTLGLIFFSKCSLSAQWSWPCCFLFFPSSSLPKASSILLPTVRFLSSPGSSWRGWGLSLLLLLLL